MKLPQMSVEVQCRRVQLFKRCSAGHLKSKIIYEVAADILRSTVPQNAVVQRKYGSVFFFSCT